MQIAVQVSLAVLLKAQPMRLWLTCRMRKPGLRRRQLACISTLPPSQTSGCSSLSTQIHGLVAAPQNVQAWADEEKAALRHRERQIAEAEARADSLLESAAADVDKQSRGLEEDRATLAKRQQQFEQVRGVTCHSMECIALLVACCISTEHQ